LFQIEEDILFGFALDVLHLAEHPRIRALVRPDGFGRFVSVIVYVPKERYDSAVRRRIGEYVARRFEGPCLGRLSGLSEGPLARTHFIIGRDTETPPEVRRDDLERGISEIVRTWADKLADALGAGRTGLTCPRALDPLRRSLRGRVPGRVRFGSRAHRHRDAGETL
jgi:glutamate dehydrogenase